MTILEREVSPGAAEPPPDPIAQAVHLRPRTIEGIEERFAATDLPPGFDVARSPRVARVLKNRRFQFMLILPNQIIFWMVIFLGLLGTVVPGLNFGTAITWYLWFCLVFVMMVVVGRAWCAMCPFGGFAEWIQRRTLWQRTQKALGLGKKMPESVARYGFLVSVAAFLILTYVEEFFNIAGPGAPSATAFMVLGIVVTALLFFLVFERRTFCRYVCPLSALIGSVGAMGSVAGFRTRDRQVCVDCATKDCMRGSETGYGCPWYTWPGSADSNLACGLCTECYKSCPSDNIGLYVQKPLTSLVAPKRRRLDVAWGVAILWGLVLFQQVNATNVYGTVDTWLNSTLHLRYPNPVDYFGLIAVFALIVAGATRLVARATSPSDASVVASSGAVITGTGTPSAGLSAASRRFRRFFVPMMYGIVPVVGADYFARQLPKFFKHVSRLIPSVGAWFGLGSTHSSLYNTRLLSDPGIVVVQVAIIALGTVGSLWATWKITGRELVPVVGAGTAKARALRMGTTALVLACGLAAGLLYVIMHAAS